MARAVNFSSSPDTLLPAEFNTVQDDYDAIGALPAIIGYGTTARSGPLVLLDDHIIGPSGPTNVTGSEGEVGFNNEHAIFMANWVQSASHRGLFQYRPDDWVTEIAARAPRLKLYVAYLRTPVATGLSSTVILSRVDMSSNMINDELSPPPTFDLAAPGLQVAVPDGTASGTILSATMNSSAALTTDPSGTMDEGFLFAIRIKQTGAVVANTNELIVASVAALAS